MIKKLLTTVVLISLEASLAHACTVCFGNPNSDLSRGFFWGIVLLGSLPFMMIAGFVSFLIYSSRKKKS